MNNADIFASFLMLLGLGFGIVSMWVVYDLDKDNKKQKHKPKKA